MIEKEVEKNLCAQINRLVYELDRSRDSHQKIISDLQLKLDMARLAIRELGMGSVTRSELADKYLSKLNEVKL